MRALVEVFQEGAAARSTNPALDDVRGKLRRSPLERNAHRMIMVDTESANASRFLRLNGYGFGDALIRLRPRTSNEALRPVERPSRVRFLIRFSRTFADAGCIPLDVLRDRFVHLVAGDTHRTRITMPAQLNSRRCQWCRRRYRRPCFRAVGDRQNLRQSPRPSLFNQVTSEAFAR